MPDGCSCRLILGDCVEVMAGMEAGSVDLMRYLIRLITPPGGTVLDPFLGTGSTGCAAMAEGFSFIGIELDQESFDTALARVSDWAFAHGRPRPTVG